MFAPALFCILGLLFGWVGVALLAEARRIIRESKPHMPRSSLEQHLPLQGRWLRYTAAVALGLVGIGLAGGGALLLLVSVVVATMMTGFPPGF